MAKRIAQLMIDIEANTASLNKGFQEAQQKLDRFGSTVKTAMKALGGAFVVREISQFVKSQIDVADNFQKLSQKTGIATTTLSAYAHGARLAGINTDDLATGFAQLSKRMLDAMQGGKEQARVFSALGIMVRDSHGGLRGLEDVLGDVAEKFAGMRDGATKAALAQELFGKSGTQLIPFLNQGRAGLEATRKEAERLGIVISSEFAQQSEKFNDSLSRLTARLQGLAITAAGPVVSAFNSMFDVLEGRVTAFKSKAEFLNTPLVKIPSAVIPGFGALMARMTPEMGVQPTAREQAVAKLEQGFAAAHAFQARTAMEQALGADAVNKNAAALRNLITGLREQIATTGMSAVALDVFKAAALGADEATKKLVHDLSFLGNALGPLKPNTEALDKVREEFKALAEIPPPNIHGEFFSQLPAQIDLAALGLQGMNEQLKAMHPLVRDLSAGFEAVTSTALQGMGRQLAGLGTSWSNFARQVLGDLADMLWRLLVMRPLMNALFGGGGGGGGGGFNFASFVGLFGGFAGGFQHGGVLRPGQWGIVGERGPEPVLATRSGAVITPSASLGVNAARSAGGVVNNWYIDNRGADLGTMAKLQRVMLESYHRGLLRNMADQQTRHA